MLIQFIVKIVINFYLLKMQKNLMGIRILRKKVLSLVLETLHKNNFEIL